MAFGGGRERCGFKRERKRGEGIKEAKEGGRKRRRRREKGRDRGGVYEEGGRRKTWESGGVREND